MITVAETNVVEVYKGGRVEIIHQGPSSTSQPFPAEPGVWQLRPIGYVAAEEPEDGDCVPVFGWARGAIDPSQWTSLKELPNVGDWGF